jgi:hypothetical protein
MLAREAHLQQYCWQTLTYEIKAQAAMASISRVKSEPRTTNHGNAINNISRNKPGSIGLILALRL